jgi:hypothetical protein
MALVGHSAATLNVFLDIPFLLRGLSQSLSLGRGGGPGMQLSDKFYDDIRKVDPLDPTSIVEEYSYDWWNHASEWEIHPTEVNQLEAYRWHIQKVNENLYFLPGLTFLPIGSTVTMKTRVV